MKYIKIKNKFIILNVFVIFVFFSCTSLPISLLENFATDAKSTTKKQQNDKLRESEKEFRNTDNLKPYIDIYWSILAPGRDGKMPKIDMEDLGELDEYLAQWKSYEEEFRIKFSLLIDSGQKYETGYPYFASVPQFVDAFEHADEYFTKAIDLYTADYANDAISNLNGVKTLAERGYVAYYMLKAVYPKDLSSNSDFINLKTIYSKLGKPIPNEYMSKINSLASDVDNLLVQASKKNKWDKNEYSYTTNEMKDIFNKEYAGELISIGSQKENEWIILRNDFGVILRKRGKGRVVYRDKNYPFDIGADIYFYKEYDGSSYLDVNAIKLQEYTFPYSR